MKMKTSPDDVSNQEILQEFLKVSNKVDGLDVSNREIFQELGKMRSDIVEMKSVMTTKEHLDNRLDILNAKIDVVDAKVDHVHTEVMEAIHDLSEHTDKQIEKALN